ncbi:acyl-CoA thioesterase II [Mycolicibacillus koreensis]|nr:acyl-CoA thioesterase II [Mycolicibacillus koreensis]
MSRLEELLDVTATADEVFTGPGGGPDGKRTYGGQLTAQTLMAAGRTVNAGRPPVSLQLQFLRAGAAGDPVDYRVSALTDGRTTAVRQVLGMQGERVLSIATVVFADPLAGPEHGAKPDMPEQPEALPPTGPAGSAPAMPLEELDIRISDRGAGMQFCRYFWWRATVTLPADPLLHAAAALCTTDVYGLDPALQVHGHALGDGTHRTGTTGTAVWFHHPIRADRWNLLASSSPAASRGRGVITAALADADGRRVATVVQEGLVTPRDPHPTERK